jgi:hypothetical protein
MLVRTGQSAGQDTCERVRETGRKEEVKVSKNKSKVSKAIPVTGHGGLYCCEMLRIPHCLETVGSQMETRLSALRTGRALLPRNIIFLLLVLISVRG